MKSLLYVCAIILASTCTNALAENVAQKRPAQASSHAGGNVASNAVDGVISDSSRWIGEGKNCSLTIELDGPKRLTTADVYSGYQQEAPVKTLRLQTLMNGKWVDIPGGRVVDNDQLAIRLVFTRPVRANRVRLMVEEPGVQDKARIREVRLWDDDPDDLGTLVQIERPSFNPVFDMQQHQVFLNQSGFNTQWPKRFTAPLSADGTTYTITPQNDNRVMYSGVVQGNIGDFSSFDPPDVGLQYVVHIEGGDLKPNTSDPFMIQPFLFERVALEPALRMFVDTRSITGSWPGAYGCAPWRDSPFYGYSTPSLVNLYLTNPSFFNQLNIEMDFEADLARALSPDFKFDSGAGENAMEILARMHSEIDPPVGDRVPDIIQLIHWGVSWWYLDPISKDWAGSANKLHPETISIPAFFLYGYPHYDEYFTDDYYTTIRDYTFDKWEEVGLFEVQTKIGTFKGRYPPGWTVLPNLMMYEVAKREGRDDAQRFMDAAVAQAKWVVDEVDLNDPLNTKGQRMSEHKTISGLVTLLTEYPEYAPQGLEDYLREWADVAISRSDNLWDFRKYNDKHWSLPRQMPGMTGGGSSWNEPGNVGGFPFLAWSVASVLGDAPGDSDRIERLNTLAVSHFDNLWGRNPLGRHTAWRGPQDFMGVERGWPIKYRPVCAHLYTVRGAICSSAATEHYPFDPSGGFRHPEGWTAFNAAFNMGLIGAVKQGIEFPTLKWDEASVIIEMKAPVFSAWADVELISEGGDRETVRLRATDYLRDTYRAKITSDADTPEAGDGVLQVTAGQKVTVRYGHGYFASEVEAVRP